MSTLHFDYVLILLLLGAVVPVAGKFRVDRILTGPDTSRRDRLRIYFSTVVFQWTLVATTAWRIHVHGAELNALGAVGTLSASVVVTTLVLVGVVTANQLLSLRFLAARPSELHGKVARVALRVFPRDHAEQIAFLAVVCTVAFCEEFLFRGFVQTLFAGISASPMIGIAGSAAFFSAAHLYQGRKGLFATFIVGVLFGGARLVSQSLFPCVIAHFVIDFIAGYYFPDRIRAIVSGSANAGPPTPLESVEHL
jgi:membrane protease YdiL (CAAX protease family)